MFDFDPEQILKEHYAKVEWWDTVVDNDGNTSPSPIPGWGLSWSRGVIYIGPCSEEKAREAAAIFIHLWLKGVSAQMASHLAVSCAFVDMYREKIDEYKRICQDVHILATQARNMIRARRGASPE